MLRHLQGQESTGEGKALLVDDITEKPEDWYPLRPPYPAGEEVSSGLLVSEPSYT